MSKLQVDDRVEILDTEVTRRLGFANNIGTVISVLDGKYKIQIESCRYYPVFHEHQLRKIEDAAD